MANPPFATSDWFLHTLDDPEACRRWLAGLGLRDPERGSRDLRDMAERGTGRDLLARLAGQLHRSLPRCPDPGMALTNLERFVGASEPPESALQALVENDRTIESLLHLFSTSQHFSEQMIRDPSLLDWLRRGAVRRDRE